MEFEENIILDEFFDKDCYEGNNREYNLLGIINHIGTIHNCHYYSY